MDVAYISALLCLADADSDAETLKFFADYVAEFTRTREDIKTWSDLLELDDFVSSAARHELKMKMITEINERDNHYENQ